ncbi:hypothetical protein [Cohaesibacter celericrescens]|uniref:hypothetical protein n=1 Tax=Cohaesibacter celericrescens TaxID=2067669 RepID=UPI0015E14686|nr:hypothetical protein [Cohaesibacter celericrescens]
MPPLIIYGALGLIGMGLFKTGEGAATELKGLAKWGAIGGAVYLGGKVLKKW